MQPKKNARDLVKSAAPMPENTSKTIEPNLKSSSKSRNLQDKKGTKLETAGLGSSGSSKSLDRHDRKRVKFEAIWTGNISMVDVATFQASLTLLYGGSCSLFIERELPAEINIVGRIPPDIVINYIDKVKNTKDIVILQFRTRSDDDYDACKELHKYLKMHRRWGVIKCKSLVIKDLYVLPLAAHESLPGGYLRVKCANMGIGTFSMDVLLAVIVKNR